MREDKFEDKFEDRDDIEEVELSGTKKIAREILGMIIYIIGVLAVCFLIITYVGQRTQVSGSSMELTLSDGDNLIIDKLSYRFKDPQRYDIIVFPYQYDTDTYYIKRIIGLPGETVWIDESGEIYIDGKILDEDYGRENITYAGVAGNPITLGTDEYFVMGDNRNNSTDSRFDVVGNIKRQDIVGKAWIRIYPFDRFGLIQHQ